MCQLLCWSASSLDGEHKKRVLQEEIRLVHSEVGTKPFGMSGRYQRHIKTIAVDAVISIK